MGYKTWEINGLSLELNLEDVDVMERYENAFELMAEEEKAIPEDGKPSQRLRAMCEMYRRLYDRIFGEGTADKIFEDTPMNTGIYFDVYMNFLDFVRSQVVKTSQTRAEKLTKFMPNRAQRRQVKK